MDQARYPSRSLRLFLVDGTPNGIVTAEIMNWTGHLLAGPRSRLSDMLKRDEAVRTGVYLLAGADPETGRSTAYIGEGDNIGKRLQSHTSDRGKDFWERTCFITSTDQNITKAHARYLESRFIQIAKDESRAALTNGTAPEGIRLPEADTADMEYFIDQVRIVLPILGFDVLRAKLEPSNAVETTIFELTSTKHKIVATAREADGEFVVQQGSTARAQWTGRTEKNASYWRRHAELLETGKLMPQRLTLPVCPRRIIT